MANSGEADAPSRLRAVSLLGGVYAAVAFGTVVALGVLSSTAPALATQEAWGHAVIVAVFAVVLLLRLRSARSGDARATRAVGIIAAVLIVVNVVEAALPGVFPPWMRVAMLLTAVLLLALLLVLVVPRSAAG